MRVFRSLLVLFCAVFPALGFAGVRASFDLKEFLLPGEGHLLETHLLFDAQSLLWSPTEEGNVQAAVELTIILQKGTEIVDFKKLRINSLEVQQGQESDFFDIQRFVVQPGTYVVEVKLKDLNASNSETASFTKAVATRLDAQQPCVSGLFFVSAYSKTQTPSELTRSGFDMLPAVSDYFPTESEKLVVYGEAYNADKAGFDGNKYIVSSYLAGEAGEIENSRRYHRRDIAQVTPLLESVPISDLPSGSYEYVMEMRSPSNELIAQESVPFYRAKIEKQTFSESIDPDAYVSTPGMAFNNPDSIRSYVSWLYPLANNVEQRTINAQVDANDPEVLKSYFFSFWESREPERPIDAWMYYVKEVWYVNRKYKSPIMPGYRTDRGRIWLAYGKPNTIVERHNSLNYFPVEIWHYHRIDRFTDRRFLFFSRNVVNYDFALLHSDMLGETQNQDWRSIVQSKNNDLRPTDSALNTMAPRDTYSLDELEDLFFNPR
ncbi:MAG: GWxTD domain-containing protein [Flavobacteriales bacterium]